MLSIYLSINLPNQLIEKTAVAPNTHPALYDGPSDGGPCNPGQSAKSVGDAQQSASEIRCQVLVRAKVAAVDRPGQHTRETQRSHSQHSIAVYETHGDEADHGAVQRCTGTAENTGIKCELCRFD